MTVKMVTVWMFLLMFVPSFVQGQMSSQKTIGKWGGSGQPTFGHCGGANQPECWHLIPGTGSSMYSTQGYTNLITSDQLGWSYNEFPSNTWTAHHEWGSVYSLQHGFDGNLYGLVGNCTIGSQTGHYIGKWNGSTWTDLGAGCYHVQLSLAPDPGGMFLSIGLDGKPYNLPNFGTGSGGSCPYPSSHGTVASIAASNSNGSCGDYWLTMSDCTVWSYVSGVGTQIPGCGNQVTIGRDKAVYLVLTGSATYHYNGNGSNPWDSIPLAATSIASDAGFNTWAIGPTVNGSNIYRFTMGQFVATRQYAGTVSCGQGVPFAECQTFQHSACGNLYTSAVTGSQVCQTPWDGNGQWGITFGVAASTIGCLDNPLMDGCSPSENGGDMNCSGGGSNNDNAPPFTFPCFSNIVPPFPHGWAHGGLSGLTITVDIDPHWNSAERTSICLGVSSWILANGANYNCVMAATSTPPPGFNTHPSLWITYVGSDVNPLTGSPFAITHPCGYNNQYGTCVGILNQVWTEVGPYSDSQLQGVMAHEEGHDNWLFDCFNCADGGSVMGSQSSGASNQPTSPTACDALWSNIWSIF